MKRILPASKRFIHLFCGLLAAATFLIKPAHAQVDQEFWFAVPYVNIHHGLNIFNEADTSFGGAQPLNFVVSSVGMPATVTIDIPSTGYVLKTIELDSNETRVYTIPKKDRPLVIVSREGNEIENKGVRIQATADITAYFENATKQNPDLFALKGKNALGTEFYTPFQDLWPNDPRHNKNWDDPLDYHDWGGGPVNIEGQVDNIPAWWTGPDTLTPDSAFSAFDIVATGDVTVEITPTADIVGHNKGETFQITLKEGQTYSARAKSQGITSMSVEDTVMTWRRAEEPDHDSCLVVKDNKAVNNLSGSYINVIAGDGKIAVTIKDDSVFENDEKDSYSGGCEDFLGDQLVPTDIIGTQYLVMKGQLNYTGVKEYLFVVATEDNTEVQVNGNVVAMLSKGKTYHHSFCEDATCNNGQYTRVETSNKAYVMQTSGYNCELAAAILPPVDICTGSRQVGFTRTYGSTGSGTGEWDDKGLFFMNLMIRKGTDYEKYFNVTSDGVSVGGVNSLIRDAAQYKDIDNSDWKAARIDLTKVLPGQQAYIIENDSALFHMSFINSTSNSWNGGVPKLTGSEFGYFSNYDEAVPDAFIVGARNATRDSIYLPINSNVAFEADGGVNYRWHSLRFKKKNTEIWEDLPIADLKLKNKNAEAYLENLDEYGEYVVTVDVRNDCFAELFTKDLHVFVATMYPPNSFTDTVCTCSIYPDSLVSVPINLYNPTDSILRKEAVDMGDYIAGWYEKTWGDTLVYQDFEGVSRLTNVDALNTSASIVGNPNTLNNNTKKALYIRKNSDNGQTTEEQRSAYVQYSFNDLYSVKSGNSFAYQYRYDETVLTDDQYNGLELQFQLIKNGSVVTTVTKDLEVSELKNPVWTADTLRFDKAIVEEDITDIRIIMNSSFDYSEAPGPFGFHFDNIELLGEDFYTQVPQQNDSTAMYVFRHPSGDNEIFANVKNDKTFRDTMVAQYMHVNDTGRMVHHIVDSLGCYAAQDSLYYDLYDYKYKVKDAVFPRIIWYADAALTDSISVTDPRYKGYLKDSATFYAYVDDTCKPVGSVTFDIVPYPANVVDYKVVVCADQEISMTGANVDLTQYNDSCFSELDGKTWQFTWYSDATLQKKVTDPTNVEVTGSKDFYVAINKPGRSECAETATLTVTVTPVADIDFPDEAFCGDDADDVLLAAQPAGGTFTIDAKPVTVFEMDAYNGSSADIVYEFTSGRCAWKDTATYTVHAGPQISIVPIDTVDYGVDTLIDATVTNGSGNYTYAWTNEFPKNKLTTPDEEDLRTEQLFGSDTFTLVVVDDDTKCNDTLSEFVYITNAPLEVYVSTPDTPYCEYTDADLRVLINGGVGKFSIKWSTGDSIVRTDSRYDTVTVSPHDDAMYYVTITDHGDMDTTIVDSIFVKVYRNPEINANLVAGEFDVCKDTKIDLDGSATGGNGAYTYEWSGTNLGYLSSTNVEQPVFDARGSEGTYNYRYIVTDSLNCKDTADIEVEVLELPTIKTDNAFDVCSGHDLPIVGETNKGTRDYAWKWEGDVAALSPLSDSSVIFNKTVTAVDVNNITLTVMDGNSCTDTLEIAVTVNPLPAVAIDNIADGVCQNSSVELSAIPSGGGYTYTWKEGSVLSQQQSFDYDNTNNDGTAAVTLIVKETATGCVDSTTEDLVIHKLLNVSIDGAPSIDACEAVDKPIAVTVNEPSRVVSYQWTSTGNTSVTPDDAFETQFSGSDAGTYTVSVLVTDDNTCDVTAETEVVIHENPSYSEPDLGVCSTDDYTLSLQASSGVTVTWTDPDGVLVNGDDPNAFVVNMPDRGQYDLTFTLFDGICSTSETLTFESELRPEITLSGGNVCADVPMSMTATLSTNTSSLNCTYVWKDGTDNIGSSSSITFASSEVGLHTITCVVTETTNQCQDVAEVELEVYENPSVLIRSIDVPDYPNVSYNRAIDLRASISGGAPGYDTSWYVGAHEVQEIDTFHLGGITSSIQVAAVATDQNGCVGRDTDSPTTEQPAIEIFHVEDCAVGTGKTDSDPYFSEPICSDCDKLSTEAKRDSCHEASWDPENFSICFDELVNLIPLVSEFSQDDEIEYTWEFNGVVIEDFTDARLLDDKMLDRILANQPLDTGANVRVKVYVKNEWMTDSVSDVIDVYVHPNPDPELTVRKESREDGSFEYFIDSDIPTRSIEDSVSFIYNWSGVVTELNYPAELLADSIFYYDHVYYDLYSNELDIQLTVTDTVSGCVGDNKYNILRLKVQAEPVCEKNPDGAMYQVHNLPNKYISNLHAQYKREGTVFDSYVSVSDWDYVRALTDSNDEIYMHHYKAYWAKDGQYTVNVDLDLDLTLQDTLVIGENVYQTVLPYPDVNINGPIDVCVGSEEEYTVSSDVGYTTVVWTLNQGKGSGNVLMNTEQDVSNVDVAWNVVGVDTLSATIDNGCPATDVKYVTAHAKPTAGFSYTPNVEIYKGTEVVFANASSTTEAGSGLNYYWDFVGEDIFVSYQENPTYAYQDMGTYPAQLVVEDDVWGCLDTAIVEVIVGANPNCYIHYPNSIAPEHENEAVRSFAADNDHVGVLEEGYSLKIFASWGALLWETTDLSARWDGTYQGAFVQQGNYMFHSSHTCETGKVVKINGDVSVFR